MAYAILCALGVSQTSCGGTRAVVVPEKEPVQLAEDVRAHVYVETKQGRVKSNNKVTLHEGQWIVTDPGEEPDEPANAQAPAPGE
ncbi:MAG: hypothetical protein KIS92_00890 [Planctomycetota bacterium]|nr:hypothetical protein [Planctomycetota bacterium]